MTVLTVLHSSMKVWIQPLSHARQAHLYLDNDLSLDTEKQPCSYLLVKLRAAPRNSWDIADSAPPTGRCREPCSPRSGRAMVFVSMRMNSYRCPINPRLCTLGSTCEMDDSDRRKDRVGESSHPHQECLRGPGDREGRIVYESNHGVHRNRKWVSREPWNTCLSRFSCSYDRKPWPKNQDKGLISAQN